MGEAYERYRYSPNNGGKTCMVFLRFNGRCRLRGCKIPQQNICSVCSLGPLPTVMQETPEGDVISLSQLKQCLYQALKEYPEKDTEHVLLVAVTSALWHADFM